MASLRIHARVIGQGAVRGAGILLACAVLVALLALASSGPGAAIGWLVDGEEGASFGAKVNIGIVAGAGYLIIIGDALHSCWRKYRDAVEKQQFIARRAEVDRGE